MILPYLVNFVAIGCIDLFFELIVCYKIFELP
jgi:hypothetical protein